MKVLRSTLTFVLGLILGIVLLIVTIVGAFLGVGYGIKVKDLPLGLENVLDNPKDGEGKETGIYNKSLYEALKLVLEDYRNFDKLTIETLYSHYGVKFLKEVSGLDLSSKKFYSTPLTTLFGDFGLIIDDFTLEDVDNVAHLNLKENNSLPILQENLSVPIKDAIDNILGSLNGDLSIRSIKDKFGIDLGVDDNDMLRSLQDVNLSSFGSVINFLRINTLLNADADAFIKVGEQQLYEKVDEYVPVTDPASKDVRLGVETYFAGAKDTDDDGEADVLDEREVRFVKRVVTGEDGTQETTYVVDNSCYDAPKEDASEPQEGDDEPQKSVEYYVHYNYKPATKLTPGKEYFFPVYANKVVSVSGLSFTLLDNGFVSLNDIAQDEAGTPFAPYVAEGENKTNKLVVLINELFEKQQDEETLATTYVKSDVYSVEGEITLDSTLTAVETPDRARYLRAHTGSAEAAIQSIAFLTIHDLQSADDLLGNRKLGELITIDDDSAPILKALKNSSLNSIATDIETITIRETMDLVDYDYVENDNGLYVKITGEGENDFYYTLYNPAQHQDMQRYDRTLPEGKTEDDISSKVLLRLAGSSLTSMDEAMKKLSLGDVLDIDMDVYAPAESELVEEIKSDEKSKKFVYYFNSETGTYRVAYHDYVAAHPDDKYYVVQTVGESNSIMKKLAFVKIDNMADAFDSVMDDTFISEIVTIVENDGVRLAEKALQNGSTYSETDKFFIEWQEGGLTENKKPVIFAYNENGTYFLNTFIYEQATDAELGAETEVFYKYENITTYTGYSEGKAAVFAKLLAAGNLFYSNDSGVTCVRNPQLCTYIVSQINQNHDVSTNEAKLYYRQKLDSAGDGAIRGVFYNAAPDSVVIEFIGDMLQYNATTGKAAGSDLPIPLDDERKLAYCAPEDKALLLTKKEGSFFVELGDSKYPYEGGPTFSKQYCEDVYVVAAEGEFVYVDGKYVKYNESYEGQERYQKKVGYVAQFGEIYVKGGSTELDLANVTHIGEVLQEASSPVLKYLADATVSNMNDKLAEATIQDIIEVTHGTIFDMDKIRTSRLDELGTNVQEVLRKIQVGNLLKWSHVEGVPSEVVEVIKDANIQSFFMSLSYDQTTGMIYVDVEKLLVTAVAP